MKTITIIGEGAWGTSIATLLATNGYMVKLWCRDKIVAETISKKRYNERYLPGIELSINIKPTTNLSEALCDVDWVFEAIPVSFLRSLLLQALPWVSSKQRWVILSKGIEQKTLLLPTQIVDDVFSSKIEKAVFYTKLYNPLNRLYPLFMTIPRHPSFFFCPPPISVHDAR